MERKIFFHSIVLTLIVTVLMPSILALTPAIERLMQGNTVTVTMKSAAYGEFLFPAVDKSSLFTLHNKDKQPGGPSGLGLSQHWQARGCYTWNGDFRIAFTSLRVQDPEKFYLTASSESYKEQGRQVKLEPYPTSGFTCPIGAKWIPSVTGVNSTAYPDRVRLSFADNGKYLYANMGEKCEAGTEGCDISTMRASNDKIKNPSSSSNEVVHIRRALIWPGPEEELNQEHHWDIVIIDA